MSRKIHKTKLKEAREKKFISELFLPLPSLVSSTLNTHQMFWRQIASLAQLIVAQNTFLRITSHPQLISINISNFRTQKKTIIYVVRFLQIFMGRYSTVLPGFDVQLEKLISITSISGLMKTRPNFLINFISTFS